MATHGLLLITNWRNINKKVILMTVEWLELLTEFTSSTDLLLPLANNLWQPPFDACNLPWAWGRHAGGEKVSVGRERTHEPRHLSLWDADGQRDGPLRSMAAVGVPLQVVLSVFLRFLYFLRDFCRHLRSWELTAMNKNEGGAAYEHKHSVKLHYSNSDWWACSSSSWKDTETERLVWKVQAKGRTKHLTMTFFAGDYQ